MIIILLLLKTLIAWLLVNFRNSAKKIKRLTAGGEQKLDGLDVDDVERRRVEWTDGTGIQERCGVCDALR